MEPTNITSQPEAEEKWHIYARGAYVGTVRATRSEVLAAVGPWVEVRGNGIDIFAPPPKPKPKPKPKPTP